MKEETPLTDRQLKDQLTEIYNNGRELLNRLASLRGNYANELNRCRSTSLDSLGIRTPSFASVMVDLQWLLEATELSDFSGAIKDRHGRDKDTYAFAVAKMAARDFYALTALGPTGMKAQYLEEYDSKRDVSHEKFGWFLTDIFKALGIAKNIEAATKELSAWWKEQHQLVEETS